MAIRAHKLSGQRLCRAGLILLGFTLLCWAESGTAEANDAFDGYTFSLGVADQNHAHEPVEDTYLGRIGIRQKWFTYGIRKDWHLRSFWELGVGYWHWNDEDSEGGELAEFALTPAFRLERINSTANGARAFVEAGVGLHLISKTHVSSRDLSSKYHFGSHVGAGWYFGEKERYEISVQVQHLSNAGLEAPNPGINFGLLTFGIRP
ncbi:MAG: acyloxyacyl hydrolase [Pseudomonadota bacterium]